MKIVRFFSFFLFFFLVISCHSKKNVTSVYMEPFNVVASRSVPSAFVPGNDYTIVVTVKKGNLLGFAKISERFPEDITAEAVDSKGGQFTFADRQVKIVWVSAPSDSVFSVSYKIRVLTHAFNLEQIAGEYRYIENNEVKKVAIESVNTPVIDLEVEGYTKATVISYEVDGCTFLLQLADEKKLEPTNLSADFKKDRLAVWIKYVPKKGAVGICMAGQIVELSDIQIRR